MSEVAEGLVHCAEGDAVLVSEAMFFYMFSFSYRVDRRTKLLG